VTAEAGQNKDGPAPDSGSYSFKDGLCRDLYRVLNVLKILDSNCASSKNHERELNIFRVLFATGVSFFSETVHSYHPQFGNVISAKSAPAEVPRRGFFSHCHLRAAGCTLGPPTPTLAQRSSGMYMLTRAGIGFFLLASSALCAQGQSSDLYRQAAANERNAAAQCPEPGRSCHLRMASYYDCLAAQLSSSGGSCSQPTCNESCSGTATGSPGVSSVPTSNNTVNNVEALTNSLMDLFSSIAANRQAKRAQKEEEAREQQQRLAAQELQRQQEQERFAAETASLSSQEAQLRTALAQVDQQNASAQLLETVQDDFAPDADALAQQISLDNSVSEASPLDQQLLGIISPDTADIAPTDSNWQTAYSSIEDSDSSNSVQQLRVAVTQAVGDSLVRDQLNDMSAELGVVDPVQETRSGAELGLSTTLARVEGETANSSGLGSWMNDRIASVAVDYGINKDLDLVANAACANVADAAESAECQTEQAAQVYNIFRGGNLWSGLYARGTNLMNKFYNQLLPWEQTQNTEPSQ